MLTPSMKMRQREGSRTSSMADSKSRTPLPQGAGGGLQRAAVDNLDPHAEEGTKKEKRALSLLGEKAIKKLLPMALLESALKVQEEGTLLSRGAQHKGGMAVVSDRVKIPTGETGGEHLKRW